MRRAAAGVVVAALTLLAAGCAKCGKAPEAAAAVPVERVLPRGAVGVVVVPRLGAAGQKLRVLEALKVSGFVAQLQGFADGRAFADALVEQLGLDVRSPEALGKAGVDAERGAGVGVLVTGEAYLALPVKDPGKLHAVLETLAHRRLGAGAGGAQQVGALTVKTFSPRQGEPPRLGYALAHGYALVAGPDALGRLAGLAAMSETDSLAADANLKAQLARLPAGADAFVYLPTGSPLLAEAPATSALATVTLAATGLAVHLDAPWKGDASQLALLTRGEAAPSVGYLPRDAFLVARYQGDPAQLGPYTRALLGAYLSRALESGGIDLRHEVLAKLRPGVVAALSLAERPPMDRGLPALDLRQTNPFSYAHLTGVATTTAPDLARPLLARVAEVAPQFGARLALTEREGREVALTTWAQGEGVHFAWEGPRVFFASPVQRLDALVKADGQAASPVAGLGDGALDVAVDLRRLAQSVRALPESAWGLGGFAIKATTVRWLDATDDLSAITLSVSAKDQAVQARLLLSLAAPTPAKAP